MQMLAIITWEYVNTEMQIDTFSETENKINTEEAELDNKWDKQIGECVFVNNRETPNSPKPRGA